MATAGELPDDALTGVLRHLSPRDLAASRSVCRAWRDVVDSRQLLRADLLPFSLRGIFINYREEYSPELFSRPCTGPAVSGNLDFVPRLQRLLDHCNGLFLCAADDGEHHHRYYVVNPATRRWAKLPPRPASTLGEAFHQVACLVFDPALSPHCKVLLIPFLPSEPRDILSLGPEMLESLWPPSAYPLQVYSSATGLWEEKLFAREGLPAGTVALVREGSLSKRMGHSAVYWRGALYAHYNNDFIMRISMSNAKYQVIAMPWDVKLRHRKHISLERSENGVHCVLPYEPRQVMIFLLRGSCSQMGWVLKYHVDLRTLAWKRHPCEYNNQQAARGPWVLQDTDSPKCPFKSDDHATTVEQKFEWNSDANVLHIDTMVEGQSEGYVCFLGLHPYKEIIFFGAFSRRAVAYHCNTSKFQDLGNICPKSNNEIPGHVSQINTSFLYSPCWIDDLPENHMDEAEILH